MSAQLLDKNNYISISEIIWPYRPDILIRIDFLDWFNKNKNKYFKKLINLSKENIINNNKFIEDAKEHPYFLQCSPLSQCLSLIGKYLLIQPNTLL